MALYMCLTGEMIDAAEALRVGLVQRVVRLPICCRGVEDRKGIAASAAGDHGDEARNPTRARRCR